MFKFSLLLVSLFALSPTFCFAQLHMSDLPAREGLEDSHSLDDDSPIHIDSIPRDGELNELTQYVMRSPDQEDAGSCLYMALTGIAEWWLAKLHPEVSREQNGPLDLSERYLMNIAGMEENDTHLQNWKTDSIYLFNRNKNQSILNSAYRYTKGWFTGETYSDHLFPSREGAPGAEYGTLYNWIDQRPSPLPGVVQLPEFEREVVFADPESNQWNVGIAPKDIVEKVKEILRKKKAPVLVIYNQNSYWHAVYVIGYNDNQDNGKCDYTERFRVRILARAEDLEKKANEATDPKVKSAYEIRAKRAREAQDKIEKAYQTQGGCTSGKGVFYIRDSIYPDVGGPIYDYDLSRTGDEAPYAKKIVYKEYDWLRYFANHISVIYPKGYSQ